MNLKRILYFHNSHIVLAIILGFGLATIFRQSCKENKCIRLQGPNLDEINNNVYKIDNECYKFTPKYTKCSNQKEIINFA